MTPVRFAHTQPTILPNASPDRQISFMNQYTNTNTHKKYFKSVPYVFAPL